MEQPNNGKYRKESLHPSNRTENGKMITKDEKRLSDEQRIGFLNQCKLELSAEVIKWKEESLKQKKENELLSQKVDELQLFANNLARKNHELETSLFLSWEENKRLRVRTLAIGEENSVLQEKLSKTKYHSYPWIDLKTSPVSNIEYDYGDGMCREETLEEVSQKLLEQMQKEMREMQQLSQTLAKRDKIMEKVESVVAPKTPSQEKLSSSESAAVQEQISSVASETEALKKLLRFQNEKLQFLLNHIVQGSGRKTSTSFKPPIFGNSKNDLEYGNGGFSNEERNLSRPSDETFRAYFTQQLNKNVAAEKQVTQVYLNKDDSFRREEQKNIHVMRNQLRNGQKFNKSQNDTIKTSSSKAANLDEKRLCPICETAFPKSVPDQEFESHVIEHLDAVSATLLDQYELV